MRHSDWGSYVCSSGLLLGTADGPATGPEADETRAVAGWVLDQILVLLHPFMPFITEELWHAGGARDHELIVAHWPSADAQSLDAEAVKEIDWLIRLVSDLRTARTELNVLPGARMPLHVRDASARSEEHKSELQSLMRISYAV